MGRRRLSRELKIFMNGRRVGTWNHGRESRFVYAEEWIADPEAIPVSLSMPIAGREVVYNGPVVDDFFDNLLPDSEAIRRRIQYRFGTATSGAFDLLSEIGRDCVGALQIVPEGTDAGDVKTISAVPLAREEIAAALRRQAGTGGILNRTDDEFRISLAGAQEKTAFLFHEGQWHRPLGATPTTHIFKRPLGIIGHEGIDLSTSLENEWLCLNILAGFGIPVPAPRLETFGNEKVLIVERFDRRLAGDGTWWIRLPQEDFCQVTGVPSGLKYQNQGGPGIRKIASILNGSVYPDQDKQTFFKAQILFWLMAAIDGHAKNFSIFLLPGGRFRMAPIYDVISAHPVTGHGTGLLHPTKLKMAMAVKGSRGNRYEWDRIARRHWIASARNAGLAPETVGTMIDEIVTAAPSVLAEMETNLPDGFPEEVAVGITEGIREAAVRLHQ